MKKYAGFWIRLLAFVIDFVILFVINSILFRLFNLQVDERTTVLFRVSETFLIYSSPLFIVTGWLYYALLESSPTYQSTFGKFVLKLRVTNINNKKISFGKASGRHFAKFISAILFGIGFLMVGFTKEKQGLHDKAAGTFVV